MTAHFGNSLTEQRRLLAGAAAVLLDAHTVIRVGGVDRASWLHALLSQNIQGQPVGASVEALLLDPQGHVEQDIHLVIADDAIWLWVGAERGQALVAWLQRMVFRSKVEIDDVSNRYAIVATIGSPLATAELHWNDPWPATAAGGFRYASAEATAHAAADWNYFENLVAIGATDAVFADLEPAGTSALDALRIAAHRPAEPELDDRTLPHELDLLATAVHLSKGCYRGQETVAKVHNLGHPPRRLVLLHLDGSGHELPTVGDEVRLVGAEAARGRITSTATHFEAGPIALAVISRGVPTDARLQVVSPTGQVIDANQEVIVPPEAGNVANLAARGLTRKNLMGGKS